MIFNMIVSGGGSGTGATLTVTAPANVTVAISKDEKTKTAISNANGIAEFKGLDSGTWSVKISDGSQTATKEVVINTNYVTSVSFFSAQISVTYPSGSVCTCSDGTTTFTAPDTSGTWKCVVPNTGMWTVSCTNGTDTDTKTVSITNDGQSQSVTLTYILYLYNVGNECTGISGGWISEGKRYSSSSYTDPAAAPITRNTTNIKAGPFTVSSSGMFYCKNTVNLSGYSQIKITGTFYSSSTSDDNLGFYVWTSLGTYYPDNAVVKYHVGPEKTVYTITIDISKLTGSHYLGFIYNTGASGYQSYIQMETCQLLK